MVESTLDVIYQNLIRYPEKSGFHVIGPESGKQKTLLRIINVTDLDRRSLQNYV